VATNRSDDKCLNRRLGSGKGHNERGGKSFQKGEDRGGSELACEKKNQSPEIGKSAQSPGGKKNNLGGPEEDSASTAIPEVDIDEQSKKKRQIDQTCRQGAVVRKE